MQITLFDGIPDRLPRRSTGRPRISRIKICLTCNSQFNRGSHPRQRYCSHECSAIGHRLPEAVLKEHTRAQRKAYYAKHKAEILEKGKKHREKNAERYREQWRERKKRYLSTDRGRVLNILVAQRRRARLKANSVGADEPVIAAVYRQIFSAPRIRCHWCNKWVKKADRHVDHVIPVAKGGLHASWNLCCACKKCNLSKHDRLPDGFLRFTKAG